MLPGTAMNPLLHHSIAVGLLVVGTVFPAAAEVVPSLAKLPTVDEEIRRALDAAPLRMIFRGHTSDELTAWQRDFSAELRKRMGPHTPPVKWTVKMLSTRDLADHTCEELLIESDGVPSLPLCVLRPKGAEGKRLPMMLCTGMVRPAAMRPRACMIKQP